MDSDTSTSDSVLLFASGAVKPARPVTDASDPRLAELRALLDATMLDLAHQIVRDGEGASKFVEVTVEGAESDEAARRIALSIGNSPLVKTMLAAADANWGRLVMAVGKAGEAADRDRLRLWIGDEQCAEGGRIREGYSEERATEHLKGDEVRLRADVGVGTGKRHHLDLRPHPRLHRHQRRLPELIPPDPRTGAVSARVRPPDRACRPRFP